MKKEELMKLDGMTDALAAAVLNLAKRSEEHTSELQSQR